LNKEKVDEDYPNLKAMLLYGSLCNNASLQVKKGKQYIDGDPTDGALLIAARKIGLTVNATEKYRIIKEIPFDSDRKRMSVVIEDENQ
ncbi:calcium-transporting ATPase, partial [Planococcus sp. SIMBA_143]